MLRHGITRDVVTALRAVSRSFRGWGGAATFLDSVLAGRRLARTRFAIGKLLGAARASGRMTVWARPAAR